MIKMSCVFMITTSTVAIYTGFAPRWLAVLGYVLSLLKLLYSLELRRFPVVGVSDQPLHSGGQSSPAGRDRRR
jgi:hypothetical protein